MNPRACRPGLKWGSWLGVLGLLTAAALALAPETSAIQPTGDPDAGREVYAATCAMCHGADARGMMGMHPALRGAVERLTVEGVEVTIRNGRRTMPPMPAFGDRLADDEIGDVIAYLATLPPGPRNFGPEMMDRDGMMGDRGMMDRMMGRGWGWAWTLVAVLLLVLVVAAVVLVITRRGKGPGEATGAVTTIPVPSSTAVTPLESCRGRNISRPERTWTDEAVPTPSRSGGACPGLSRARHADPCAGRREQAAGAREPPRLLRCQRFRLTSPTTRPTTRSSPSQQASSMT